MTDVPTMEPLHDPLREPGFRSFMMGGFEDSTHVLRSGRRLDMIAATRHDTFARQDYERMRQLGMTTARDGIRWHRIERTPGTYDFDDAKRMVRAALDAKLQVIWDLLHFGWPDHVDVFAPDFPKRFGDFAGAFAAVLRAEGDPNPMAAPVNEISFLSFAGGEARFFNPFAERRGDELKRQLVRASIAAGTALRAALPAVRLVHTDPIIHVVPRPGDDPAPAEAHRQAQFQAWDMLAGRIHPELGGSEQHLDILGVNYYVHNQWYYPGGHGSMIHPSSPQYRPLRDLLRDTYARYRRPMIIAETGIENDERPDWLAYVGAEARAAIRRGADLHGLCLYPIVNHPGWDDDRHCRNGLWDYADDRGDRPIYEPLAREIAHQAERFERLARQPDFEEAPGPALEGLDAIARSIAEATLTSREG